MREHSLELVGVGIMLLWVGAVAVAAEAVVDVTVVECAVVVADQHSFVEFLVALKRAAVDVAGVC